MTGRSSVNGRYRAWRTNTERLARDRSRARPARFASLATDFAPAATAALRGVPAGMRLFRSAGGHSCRVIPRKAKISSAEAWGLPGRWVKKDTGVLLLGDPAGDMRRCG